MVLEPRHCAHLDRVLLGMFEEPVGRDCSTNMERNQTEESEKCVPLLGPVAGG